MKPVEECLNIIFTKKGRKWFDSLAFKEKESKAMIDWLIENNYTEGCGLSITAEQKKCM